MVNNICKEFHVREEWLRTGAGEMFLELSHEDEISDFINDVLRDESADFKRRLIAALSKLDSAGWDALEQLVEDTARRHAADQAGRPPWTEEEHAIWEAEARAEAEQVYREVLEEKRAEAGYSASPPGGGGVA